MERYIRFIIGHRFAVIFTISLITIFLGYECKNLRIAIKLKEQLPQNHPYIQIQNRIEELFGGDSVQVIGIFAKDTTKGSIYNTNILQKVVNMTNGLLSSGKMQSVIRSSIISISSPNIKAVEGGDEINIYPLLEEPITDAKIVKLKELLAKDTLLRESLVNKEENATIIAMDVDSSESDRIIQKNLESLIDVERDDSVVIVLAGGPALRTEINKYTKLAFPLMLLAIVIIGLIHYHAFRTWQAAVLPLITAIISMIWALGILGITGRMMDSWSSVTPIVILAVAAGHAVQILKRYYEELKKTSSSEEAVVKALSAVGPVMLRVGIVASFGFASLIFVRVESVRVFGMLLAIGIVSALIIEMTFVPAWRSKMIPTRREQEREDYENRFEQILTKISKWVIIRPKQCVLVWIICVLGFGFGIHLVQVNNNVYEWLPKSSTTRQAYELLNQRLGGATSFKILIEGNEENTIKEPSILSALNDLEIFMRAQQGLNRIYGFADIIRRINNTMSENDTVPNSRRLVEQYLVLYPSDAYSGFVDFNFQYTIIQAFTEDNSTGFAERTFKQIRNYANKRFDGLPIRARVAGGALSANAAMDQVVVAEKESNMIQVSFVIYVLATFFLGSFVGGIYVLIPMMLALAINLGMMGWFGIWFDMTCAAITAMGISIGADFAIYFIYRAREEVKHHPDRLFSESIMQALLTSGKAIFYVSSAIIGGFIILCLSPFLVWQHLGLLTALIVLVHALSAITILPALIVIFRPQFVFSK